MKKHPTTFAIAPLRQDNFAEWYLAVVREAQLAEHAPVRGCMVIKPWGYALWERMQAVLDKAFKAMGHENAYFPLLIPLHFLQKEAEHVAGFAKECAVVTHHRLISDQAGRLIPDGALEEPYVIRPTSETIIGECFAKWVQSYRDLPLQINQWANVVRWEMRTRLFLRTTEFLWQEGHTAHATPEEAREMTRNMINLYRDFAEQWMGMAVVLGEKTAEERFPGAMETWTIEAMMPDGKALQAGTSHFLGQHFSRAADIRFLDPQGQSEYAWTTSWGVSTRLIGGLIMSHGDDDGAILPPMLAPVQLCILIAGKIDDPLRMRAIEQAREWQSAWENSQFRGQPLRIAVDDRPINGGEKYWQWVKKGVPVMLEYGPRDAQSDHYCLRVRKPNPREKVQIPRDGFLPWLENTLENLQCQLLSESRERLQTHTHTVYSQAALRQHYEQAEKEGYNPGWVRVPCQRDRALDATLKPLKLSARCILSSLNDAQQDELQDKRCIVSGEAANQWVIVGRSY